MKYNHCSECARQSVNEYLCETCYCMDGTTPIIPTNYKFAGVIGEKEDMVNCHFNHEGTLQQEKPPLGVMPRDIWEHKRAAELSRAIHDHIDSGYLVPVFEWVKELSELLNKEGD